VRRRCRKRRPSTRPLPMTPAERVTKRWSVDLVSDSLWTGRRVRAWGVVDDYSKESPMSYVDSSISGLRMAILRDA
jgi:putative transposase